MPASNEKTNKTDRERNNMRLNKYISHNTRYSRREADTLIEAGEVSIDKTTIKEFGYDVQDEDRVFVKRQADQSDQ